MNAPSHYSRSKAKIATYLLLIVNCLSPMAAIVIAPSLPLMQAHYSDVPNVEFLVPMALTIPGLLVALLSPLVGMLADHVGRKRLLVASIVGYGIFGVMPLFLDSLYTIIASRIALGCVEAVVVTISTTLIGDYYSGAARQKYLALQTTFASASAILFFLIGGALGEFGWRMPYIVYALPLLLAVISHVLLWEPKRVDLADGDQQADGAPQALRLKLMVFICTITAIGAVAFMVLQIQMAFLLGSVNVSSPTISGMIASACSVMIVLGTLSVHLLSRIGLRTSHYLGLAFGLIALSFLLIPGVRGWEGMLAVALVNGLGCGILLPTLAIWNMRELPWQHRGLGTGMWYGSYCLGVFVSPLLVVAISQQTGNLQTTIAGIGWMLVPIALAAFAVSLIRRSRRRAPSVMAANLEDA